MGADIGATLAKLAVRDRDGSIRYAFAQTADVERVVREIESASPTRVGLTGGGAAKIEQHLKCDTSRTDEFSCWRHGAIEMLRLEHPIGDDPFLLVSLGTGTSALRVDGDEVTRIGGTALGGGTLLGLGIALTASRDFDALIQLASQGDRRKIDLLVSDIYPSGDRPLPGDLNAASFAKLADPSIAREPADLAHAVVGMIGENIGLICGSLAAASELTHIVYGGSTLRGNQVLMNVLRVMAVVGGHEAIFLAHPEYAGAAGALRLAEEPAERIPVMADAT